MNFKDDKRNKELDMLRYELSTIDTEWQMGLITIDDVRVRLSKLYASVHDAKLKKCLLNAYDSLERIERK
jgi:hypothetical protein